MTSTGEPRSLPDRRPLVAVVAVGGLYVAVAATSFFVSPLVGTERWPLQHDQAAYYAYLPALLTEEGLSFEGLTDPRWTPTGDEGRFWPLRRVETTGRLINPFTPGVALLQAPLFALGHGIAWIAGRPTDGLSGPYRFLAGIGGALYAAAGLLFLLLALRMHFAPVVAAAVVTVLGVGTNLLYYAAVEPLMTHAYSFFAFALLLWATLAWARSAELRLALVAGAALGLVVIVRPTNGVVALVPIGYLAARRWLDRARPDTAVLVRHLAAAAAVTFLVTLPLLAYWRYASGSWITNPHGPGTFYLDEPRIGGVLWSYRKGWFVYTPVMLAAVPGLFLLRRHLPRMTLPLVAYCGLAVYIASAYWSWWYGGSFGMRALIETSAPLSLAVAAFFAWAAAGRRRLATVGSAVGLLVALNVFQTYQYVMVYIHWDGMTEETYWSVFLRPVIPAAEMERIREGLDRSDSRGPRAAPDAQ